MGWKTIVGTVLAALSWAWGQYTGDGLTLNEALQAIGVILGGVGARHAIAKRKGL